MGILLTWYTGISHLVLVYTTIVFEWDKNLVTLYDETMYIHVGHEQPIADIRTTWSPVSSLCQYFSKSADLTFDGAVPRYFLRHQQSLLVFTVNLHDLLPTPTALGSRQGRNRFFPTDLALWQVHPWLQTRLQHSCRLLGMGELHIPLDSHGSGGLLGVGFPDMGLVVTEARCSGLDGRELEDLVSRFVQGALCLGLIQLAPCICSRHSLALGLCSQVAVAVDGVKVFGDGVFIIVTVRAKFLFWVLGFVDTLWKTNKQSKKVIVWNVYTVHTCSV